MNPKLNAFVNANLDIIGKDVKLIVGYTPNKTAIQVNLDNKILYLVAYIKSIIADKNKKIDYYETLWKKLFHVGKIRQEWDADAVGYCLAYLKQKNFCEHPQWAPESK